MARWPNRMVNFQDAQLQPEVCQMLCPWVSFGPEFLFDFLVDAGEMGRGAVVWGRSIPLFCASVH